MNDSKKEASSSGAIFIALGIFLSRIAGLIRERALAYYFGNSDTADAFKAALKIPNFLQNLFGEGALSASFIPVYSELISKGEHQKANQVAKTLFALMLLVISTLVTAGVILTPYLIDLVAPGFEGTKKELTIKLVQILFPGTGLLVLSAWCLGILNSHRQFFLSYFAPVIWNFTIILTLFVYGQFIYSKNIDSMFEVNLVIITCVGVSVGSLLQFLIQVPKVLKFVSFSEGKIDFKDTNIKTITKNFGPALISRGIVQISAYIDNIIASYLSSGAISGLAFSQVIATLPISLFGMSISQSELTTMSKAQGDKVSDEDKNRFLLSRLQYSFKRLNFFIIPTFFVFIFLGDILIGTLFQTGQFTEDTTKYVWTILIGSSFGLLGSTKSRVLSSSFYALKDTKTPMLIAIVRVITTTVLGIFFSLYFYKILGISTYYQASLLALSFGIASSIEFFMLRHALSKKIALKIQDDFIHLGLVFFISLISAGIVYSFKFTSLFLLPPIMRGLLFLGFFAVLFLLGAYLFKIEEVKLIADKIFKKLRK